MRAWQAFGSPGVLGRRVSEGMVKAVAREASCGQMLRGPSVRLRNVVFRKYLHGWIQEKVDQ